MPRAGNSVPVSANVRCGAATPLTPVSASDRRAGPARLVTAPHAPDVLHRPAPRPVAVDLVAVAARRLRRRAQFEQLLDDQPVLAEQPNPGAVGKLEGGWFPRLLEGVHVP